MPGASPSKAVGIGYSSTHRAVFQSLVVFETIIAAKQRRSVRFYAHLDVNTLFLPTAKDDFGIVGNVDAQKSKGGGICLSYFESI